MRKNDDEWGHIPQICHVTDQHIGLDNKSFADCICMSLTSMILATQDKTY